MGFAIFNRVYQILILTAIKNRETHFKYFHAEYDTSKLYGDSPNN
jgi:hypothetical protein